MHFISKFWLNLIMYLDHMEYEEFLYHAYQEKVFGRQEHHNQIHLWQKRCHVSKMAVPCEDQNTGQIETKNNVLLIWLIWFGY